MAETPRYERIRKDLVDQIDAGVLGAGARVPSESELATKYGVSRMTVRQAIGALEGDGWVVRRRGAGTFVRERTSIARGGNRLGPLHEQLGVTSSRLATRWIEMESVVPPAEVADRLGLAAGAMTSHLVRVRQLDGRPIAVQESWVPLIVAPGLIAEAQETGSLYEALARLGAPVASAEQEVTASRADGRVAELLKAAPGDPLLRLRRTAFALHGAPVEYAESYTVEQVPLVMRLDGEPFGSR